MTTELTDAHDAARAPRWLHPPTPPPAPERHLPRALAWAAPLVLVAGALAYTLAALQPSTYEASGRVVLAAAPAPDGGDYVVVDSVSALANRHFLGTFSDILGSAAVTAAAVSAARLEPPHAGAYRVDNAISPASSSVDVRVRGPDAERAAVVARNVVEEAGALFEDYYPVFTVRVLDAPTASREPVGPRPLGVSLIAAALTAGVWLLALLAHGRRGRA